MNSLVTEEFWKILLLVFGRTLVPLILIDSLSRRGSSRKYLLSKKIQKRTPSQALRPREIKRTLINLTLLGIVLMFHYRMRAWGFIQTPPLPDSLPLHLPSWTAALGSFVAYLLLQDTYFYWTHRALHSELFYRRFHRIHHESRTPHVWSALSMHPFEAILEALVWILIPLMVPMFGTSFEWALIYSGAMTVFGHSGFELGHPTLLRYRWATSTTHHDLHHSRIHGNFGLFTQFWDRLMKTDLAES